MRKHDGILKRVRQLEEKRGIVYAKADGKLCTALSIFNLIAAIFALTMNTFYILGMLLINLGTENIKNVLNPVITVSVCSATLISGLILKKFKLFIPSAILNILSSALLIPLFASLMEDINGFLQLKTAFYWRHLAPLTIVIIMTVWITVIAIREKAKLNATYRKVEENLYNIYHASANEVNEEQWEEFLNEYNGESPVQVITSKNEETEE